MLLCQHYIVSQFQMNYPRTSQPARMASVDLKKAVSVIKCFICNQMFYSQNTFDDHMKLHSSKLTRNLPEQIQRKTMQSFRVKKNSSTSGNRQSVGNVVGKKILNQTASLIRPKGQQVFIEAKKDDNQDEMNRIEMKEAEEALRQSTILIQKLQGLIKEKDQPKLSSVNKSEQYVPITPTQSQQIFLTRCLQGQKVASMQQQALKTKFQNIYLQSCQDQLQYLNQLLLFLDSDTLNKQKYSQMKKDILNAMVDFVRQNTVISKEQIDQSGLLLTQISNKEKSSQETVIEVQMIENEDLGYCNHCYIQISYGQDCYQEKKYDENSGKQRIKYHLECWQEVRKQRKEKTI